MLSKLEDGCKRHIQLDMRSIDDLCSFSNKDQDICLHILEQLGNRKVGLDISQRRS